MARLPKYLICFLPVFMLIHANVFAQPDEGLVEGAKRIAPGFGIGQFQNDFGLNLNVKSIRLEKQPCRKDFCRCAVASVL